MYGQLIKEKKSSPTWENAARQMGQDDEQTTQAMTQSISRDSIALTVDYVSHKGKQTQDLNRVKCVISAQ